MDSKSPQESVEQHCESSSSVASDLSLSRILTQEVTPAGYVGEDTPRRNLEKTQTLTFRVTGAAAIARLNPLLLGREWGGGRLMWTQSTLGAVDCDETGGGNAIDFVYETTVTKALRKQHRRAKVLNRLSGAQVLEDKGSLALLQRLMMAPTLESRTAMGRTNVERWAHEQFKCQQNSGQKFSPLQQPGRLPSPVLETEKRDSRPRVGDNWWCIKASGGNGGMDIWVIHEGNWHAVVPRLSETEQYVIQRYVARPMLWRERKFHFRCYAILRADMSAWLYRTAYILCASRPYKLDDGGVQGGEQEGNLVDELTHITNLAVNKHTIGHPGQVPCDVPSEYPFLWPLLMELLRSLVESATPFMQHQAAPGHFEFLGLDFIADEGGGVWLMEGLQSSKQNMEEENGVYDRMMADLVRLIVLPSLLGYPPEPGLFEAAAQRSADAKIPSSETWRNVMRFAAYKRACKRGSELGCAP